MIRLYGYIPDNDISIKFSGLRPGEKLFEELLMNSENSIPTYHEKILIARVKDIILDEITGEFDYLFKLSREQISTFELVKQMKKMVPEFLSNNSVFEALDHRGHESNVVPISRIS
jgi:FlaA1/EpsC-like NDP-sugar epimerase